MTAFVRYYAFISQIVPYSDRDQEMLYSFGRFLSPHLDLGGNPVIPHPEREVQLQYYRIEKMASGVIDLEDGVSDGVKSPTAVGTAKSIDEDKPLSEIIATLNDRFGTDFTEEDRLFFEQIKEKACNDDRIIQTARANPLDKFELGIRKNIESLMVQRMSENDSIVSRYMDDTEFQKVVFPILAKEIYNNVLKKMAE